MKNICIIGILFFALIAIGPEKTMADNITPSHVYQKTEELRVTLEALNLLDVQAYEEEKEDVALRHPRHVMQKVRECHTVLGKILQDRSLKTNPLPDPFSVREVRPSDVENGVKHLLKELQKLSFADTAQPEFVDGKVPNDVYNNLKRICHAVRVEITPSEVYQVALSVNDNLDKIMRVRDYNEDIKITEFSDKLPADVYQKTWIFLQDLRTLALNPDFAIPGGVILPNEVPERKIIPQDVIALMHDALAETNAIKYTLGIHEKNELPPFEEGKAPSDVYTQIERAHRIIKMLLTKEASE